MRKFSVTGGTSLMALIASFISGLAIMQSAHSAIFIQTGHAAWVFAPVTSATNAISNPVSRQALIDKSVASNVTVLYLSVYRSQLNAAGRLMYEDVDVADLIAKAHAKGIQVWAAYGAPDWPSLGCDVSGFPMQRFNEIVAFNVANALNRFDGVILDTEPPVPPATAITATDYGALLTQYQCFALSAHSNAMSFGAAIRFGWKDVVTYNRVSKEFFKHAIDLVTLRDRIVVMGYRNFAGTIDPLSDGIIASDQDQFAYASSVGKSSVVLAGLETSDPATTGISDRETFYRVGQATMDSVAQVVLNHFGAGFGGFAVHNYDNAYLSGLSAQWPTTDPNFPRYGNGVSELATPPGAPVTVTPSQQVNATSVTLTFPSVSPSPQGYTYVRSIVPASAGTMPSNYVLSGLLAFDITTTAVYTGPVTVCFRNVPLTSVQFSTLRVLHNSGAGLIDETILRGANAPDPITRSICASVTSFSPFVLANIIGRIKPGKKPNADDENNQNGLEDGQGGNLQNPFERR